MKTIYLNTPTGLVNAMSFSPTVKGARGMMRTGMFKCIDKPIKGYLWLNKAWRPSKETKGIQRLVGSIFLRRLVSLIFICFVYWLFPVETSPLLHSYKSGRICWLKLTVRKALETYRKPLWRFWFSDPWLLHVSYRLQSPTVSSDCLYVHPL